MVSLWPSCSMHCNITICREPHSRTLQLQPSETHACRHCEPVMMFLASKSQMLSAHRQKQTKKHTQAKKVHSQRFWAKTRSYATRDMGLNPRCYSACQLHYRTLTLAQPLGTQTQSTLSYRLQHKLTEQAHEVRSTNLTTGSLLHRRLQHGRPTLAHIPAIGLQLPCERLCEASKI